MKAILLILAVFNSFHLPAQIGDRRQPDSIYVNRKVKRMYAYLNSNKDLSEIIEFDREGRIVNCTRYSASYDKATRKNKRVERIVYYQYDSLKKLKQTTDSILYLTGGNDIERCYFYYNVNGNLISSSRFQNRMPIAYSETLYQTNPYCSRTILIRTSTIIYDKITEYDRDFYIKKTYGCVLESKLKEGMTIVNGDSVRVSYSDDSDGIEYQESATIENKFDDKGQLVSASYESKFLKDRVSKYHLLYQYYPNGLLKSISGYVPEFFKYDFYE